MKLVARLDTIDEAPDISTTLSYGGECNILGSLSSPRSSKRYGAYCGTLHLYIALAKPKVIYTTFQGKANRQRLKLQLTYIILCYGMHVLSAHPHAHAHTIRTAVSMVKQLLLTQFCSSHKT